MSVVIIDNETCVFGCGREVMRNGVCRECWTAEHSDPDYGDTDDEDDSGLLVFDPTLAEIFAFIVGVGIVWGIWVLTTGVK